MNLNDIKLRKQIIQNITFKFDKKIKRDIFTTSYFIKSYKVLKNKYKNRISTMQFIHFNDDPIMMCGSNEIKQLLKFYLTKKQRKRTQFYCIEDGTIIKDKNVPLLVIKGYYPDFMKLENIIDGILSRRCSVATNVMKAMNNLLSHQKIIYMLDRNIDYINQKYEAYPAYLAGIDLFVTQEQISLIKQDSNVKVIGTMPHSLIQQYQNNLTELIDEFYITNNTNKIICLLDYENDIIKTLNQIKNKFSKLEGVRIDTSNKLIDKSLTKDKLYGINYKLIDLAKKWLIDNNLSNKKIVITSSIDDLKIKTLNQQTKNVDFYGIGSYFSKMSVHVTADLVEIDNKHEAKSGRRLLNNFNKLVKEQL